LDDGLGTLTPRLDLNWQSTVYQDGNSNPFTAIPARAILNGRVTWDAPQGGWQVALAMYNMTNKQYFYDMINFAAFGEGTVEANPAPPREWTITIKKSF